jgi:Mg-chelatase subunit ChlD
MTTSIRRAAQRALILIFLAALTAWVAHAGGITFFTAKIDPAATPGTASLATAASAVDAAVQLPAQLAPRIEVAFVLDTTGSMAGLIEGAKQKIWSIANRMASGMPRPHVRIALVGYRDRGDSYVTTRVDLTDDIDDVYARLMSFTADGGGDTPESVNQALHESVSLLDWSEGEGVYRVVFLVGDAPPHMDYADDVPYAQSVRLAAQRNIAINTVQCGDMAGTTSIWQEIASLGGGQYAAIQLDGAMLAIVTPVDEELGSLNRDLAKTALLYGDEDEKEEIRQKLARSVSAPSEVAASRLSYLDKLGGRLNAGRRDLVDAVKDGLVSLADVDQDDLPAELSGLSRDEQNAFVQQRIEERKQLRARIGELSKQRDDFVRADEERRSREGDGRGFDAQVFETVKEQAAAAGISYE